MHEPDLLPNMQHASNNIDTIQQKRTCSTTDKLESDKHLHPRDSTGFVSKSHNSFHTALGAAVQVGTGADEVVGEAAHKVAGEYNGDLLWPATQQDNVCAMCSQLYLCAPQLHAAQTSLFV